MNAQKRRLDGITILRFVAALYVFMFHANMRIDVNFPSIIGYIIKNGAIGMSLFFILSGFVLTYNYDTGVGNGYFLKRIKRIYPAYLFCGLITLPVLLYRTQLELSSILKTITTLFLYVTATQSWVYPSFTTWQFGGTWSISTEMFFYALFPLLLKVANSKNLHYMALIAFISTALIIPISLLYTDGLLFTVYYATPIYRLPEFVMGIVAAKYMKRGFKVNHISAFLLLIFMSFVACFNNIGFMQYNFVLVPSICIMLIYASTHSIPKFFYPIIHLGEISYSFYLMQVAGFMIADHFHPDFIYKSGIYGWIILFVIFTLMAQISYSLFEKRNSLTLIRNFISK